MSVSARLLQVARGEQPPPPLDEDDAAAGQIADAALRQFELFGLVRSTMEDVARRAKVSRVTVYRRFPGKDALIDAVAMRELRRFLERLDAAIADIEDPGDMIVEGFVFTLHAVRTHRLLQRLLESEPEAVLPHLTVEGGPFIAAAREFIVARNLQLDPERDPEDASTVADIIVRLILSYLLTPQATVDLDDPDVARAFARRYLRPLLLGGDD